MGLTKASVGHGAEAMLCGNLVERRHQAERIVALAGNPNVGKSTVFIGSVIGHKIPSLTHQTKWERDHFPAVPLKTSGNRPVCCDFEFRKDGF